MPASSPGQSRDRAFPDAHVPTCAPKQHAQDEAGCSQNADVAFKVQKSSNAMEDDGVFTKIDGLLRKVDELAAEVPTTSDRLGCIAGIFLEGHGPREESMKEATERDVASIGSIRSVTSHICTAFNDLKKKQDAICKGFENDARIIVSQISKQKNDVSAPVRGDDCTGQRGEEVVVNAPDDDEDEKQEPPAESPPHDFSDDNAIDDDLLGGDSDGGCKGVDDIVDYMEGVFAPDQPVAQGDCDKSNEPKLGQQVHPGSVGISEGKHVGFDCQGNVSVTIEGGLEFEDHASNESSQVVAHNVDRGSGLLDGRQAPEGACESVFVMDGVGDGVNHAASCVGKQALRGTSMPESIGARGDVFPIPVREMHVVDGACASNKDAKHTVVSEFLKDATVVDTHPGGVAHATVAGPKDASVLNVSCARQIKC